MPPASLDAGTRFGSYTVLRLLGEGGMGAVYEARHERLSKRVALKVLHAEIAATNEEAVARFMREGEAASRIRHPNVVDVTDFGVEDGIPFLVMEFLEGESLGTVLETRGALEVSEAVDLMLPIASALAAAHEEQIVHRDLKPDNIFLSRTRIGEVVPKLVDFGISKLVSEHDPRLTAADAMIGTPQYMSPEQARGSRGVDARTDQYAFGVILFECLTGQTAVQGESLLEILHEINSGRISQIDALRPGVPPGLVAAVARMHARDPKDRFPGMIEAGAALLPYASARAGGVWGARFMSGESPSPTYPAGSSTPERTSAPTPLSTPPSPWESAKRAPKFRALAVLVVVGLGGLAIAPGFRQDPVTPGVTALPVPSPEMASPSEPPSRRVDGPASPLPTPPVPSPAASTVVDAGAAPAAPELGSAEEPPDAGRPNASELYDDASAHPGSARAPGAASRRPSLRPGVKRGANRSIILR